MVLGDTEIGPLDLSDVPTIRAALDDPGIRKSLMRHRAVAEGEAEKWIQDSLDYWTRDDPCWMFAVRERGGEELIGRITILLTRAGHHTIEYWIAPSHQGRGHAKRATQLAVRFAFCVPRVRVTPGRNRGAERRLCRSRPVSRILAHSGDLPDQSARRKQPRRWGLFPDPTAVEGLVRRRRRGS